MFRKTLLMSLAMLMTGACSPLSARPLVDVSVVDRDTGEWLREYPHRGDTWVAGTPGDRYSVRLSNTTGERVLVVLSVDGVNAVTGQTAHPAQTGYVLAPYQSTEISGWRKSYEDVAQFVFTALGDSYAARTGRPDNVGTIGVAVFRERRVYPRLYPTPSPPIAREGEYGKSTRNAAPAAEASRADGGIYDDGLAQQQRIGTGHGQREWSPVGQTAFVRASSQPAQVTQLRYDSPDALAARGILPRPAPYWSRHDRPRAFPGGFVADPPGRWR